MFPKLLLSIMILFSCFTAFPVHAQLKSLDTIGKAGGYAVKDKISPEGYLNEVWSIIRNFLGVIALILIIYAGFKWMLSYGNVEDITKAKRIMIYAIIGLVVLFSVELLVSFVLTSLA